MANNVYWVEFSHPTNYVPTRWDNIITVKENPDHSKYCVARGLGCSRHYRRMTDEMAIREFLRDHAMTLEHWELIR